MATHGEVIGNWMAKLMTSGIQVFPGVQKQSQDQQEPVDMVEMFHNFLLSLLAQ